MRGGSIAEALRGCVRGLRGGRRSGGRRAGAVRGGGLLAAVVCATGRRGGRGRRVDGGFVRAVGGDGLGVAIGDGGRGGTIRGRGGVITAGGNGVLGARGVLVGLRGVRGDAVGGSGGAGADRGLADRGLDDGADVERVNEET